MHAVTRDAWKNAFAGHDHIIKPETSFDVYFPYCNNVIPYYHNVSHTYSYGQHGRDTKNEEAYGLFKEDVIHA